jgi:hypothetical protein
VSPILGIWASQNYPRITGSYESIATTTVGGGGAASISFTSIPATYTHLQIRAMGRSSTGGFTNTGVTVRMNNDTTSNYSNHGLDSYGTGISAFGSASTSSMYIGEVVGSTGLANAYGVFVLDILDYANTNKYKTIRTLIGQNQNSASSVGNISLTSGSWRSTSAVDRIDLTTGFTLAQYSSFALYGIKS